MTDPNLPLVQNAALKLGDLLSEVVFIGGCTTGLLITDEAAAPSRGTLDVDVIAEITTYAEYTTFSDRLRALGFAEDSREGAPVCRWLNGNLILDVMPLNENILGFTNSWYRDAIRSAEQMTLPNGLQIRVISAAYFLGTKMEAFRGRGGGDFFSSHDLEDFVAVIEGRESILAELAAVPADLRHFLADAAERLLSESRFRDALPGYLLPDEASQTRIAIVLHRLTEMAALR